MTLRNEVLRTRARCSNDRPAVEAQHCCAPACPGQCMGLQFRKAKSRKRNRKAKRKLWKVNSKSKLAGKFSQSFGGARRNRTADKGFADLCLTTWRPRPRIRKESSPQALALAIRFFPGKIVKICCVQAPGFSPALPQETLQACTTMPESIRSIRPINALLRPTSLKLKPSRL